MENRPGRKQIQVNPEIEGEELLGPFRDPLPDENLHPEDDNHHGLVPTRLYPTESESNEEG